MIKHTDKTIELMNHNDALINKVMYMDSVAYERMDGESGYTPTPPTFDKKFKGEYSDGKTYIIDCDGDSALKYSEMHRPLYSIENLTNGIIGECVTKIGSGAFDTARNLSAITIPSTVTIIGSSAFDACSRLQSVVIPYGVERIETQTFFGCGSLSSATIPNTVTYIGVNAFSGCRSLTGITIPSSVEEISTNAFNNCASLTYAIIEPIVPPITTDMKDPFKETTCPLYVPDESVDAYKTADGWKRYKDRIFPLSEYQG